MYCNANKDSCNTFEARCNSTKDACIMQRIYIRRHFLYLRLKSVKELVNYNTRKTMKQKQKLKRWSGVLIALGVLGSSFTSCSSIKKGNDLPVVGKSVALFDYFNYKGEDDVYISNPLPGDDYFYNPILPGWYSDPSICTNGEGDYFLAVSTFTYYPGVPLFHSKDLVNWKQVGHILNRPSQLVNMEGQHVSGGIFAPAISYNPHNKTYYMVTTNVGAGNFFVKTQDPFGEWSDPIMLPEVTGIDPSYALVNGHVLLGKIPVNDSHSLRHVDAAARYAHGIIAGLPVVVHTDERGLSARHVTELGQAEICFDG